tara:strand:- start:4465 stop:5202 length:738 start_codon:yes stop_codon:yes gene_type:complete
MSNIIPRLPKITKGYIYKGSYDDYVHSIYTKYISVEGLVQRVYKNLYDKEGGCVYRVEHRRFHAPEVIYGNYRQVIDSFCGVKASSEYESGYESLRAISPRRPNIASIKEHMQEGNTYVCDYGSIHRFDLYGKKREDLLCLAVDSRTVGHFYNSIEAPLLLGCLNLIVNQEVLNNPSDPAYAFLNKVYKEVKGVLRNLYGNYLTVIESSTLTRDLMEDRPEDLSMSVFDIEELVDNSLIKILNEE